MSFKFLPFSEKQQKVLSWWAIPEISKKYDAIIADGSIRSGKTMSMSLSFVLWAMSNFKGCNFAICGKTVGACYRNVIKPLKTMIETRFKVVFKRSENMIEISKGAFSNYFYIFGGKDESSQDLIQGLTLAGVLLDEVALMPRSFVDQALGRCSVAGAKFWFNCNPASPSHWFYTEWLLKLNVKKALYLHFLMDDNLTLSQEVKNRYKNMYSGTFYRRYIQGEWVVAEGLVYQQYNDVINDKLFRGDPNGLAGTWYISMDYGTINPCSMGLWCVTREMGVRTNEYYFDSRKAGYQRTDEEHYAELEKLAEGKNIRYIVCDPSAASFITTVRRHGKFAIIPAVNDVINGIRITSDLLRNGKAVIGERCEDSIREFGLYSWDIDSKSGEDTVVKENDHAMDDIRYFCNTVLAREYHFSDWRSLSK